MKSSAPQVRIRNFPANLWRMPLRRNYRERVTHCCKHPLLLLIFCHQSGFFTLLSSVPPKQDPRKIVNMLIELAFSSQNIFFFFVKHLFTNINIYRCSKYIDTVCYPIVKYIVVVVYLVYIYELILDVYFVKLYEKVTQDLLSQLKG